MSLTITLCVGVCVCGWVSVFHLEIVDALHPLRAAVHVARDDQERCCVAHCHAVQSYIVHTYIGLVSCTKIVVLFNSDPSMLHDTCIRKITQRIRESHPTRSTPALTSSIGQPLEVSFKNQIISQSTRRYLPSATTLKQHVHEMKSDCSLRKPHILTRT